MTWINARIKWFMLVIGALTMTMLYAFVAPAAAIHSSFGASLTGEVPTLVVRNWGGLIALVGGMLIYGASHPEVRRLVLVTAAISKTLFVALVLSHGSEYLSHGAGVAVVVDSLAVLLFVGYLATGGKTAP